MIQRIISGGQNGADRAGLDAAIACGVAHGGWCPRGRLAEDGTIPDRYQLTETEGGSFLERTERNVESSDGTVIFTMGTLTGGSLRTANFAYHHEKPWIHLRLGDIDDEAAVIVLRRFVADHRIQVLNVAGSRGSGEPGLYGRVFEVIRRVLGGIG